MCDDKIEAFWLAVPVLELHERKSSRMLNLTSHRGTLKPNVSQKVVRALQNFVKKAAKTLGKGSLKYIC